MEAGEGDSFARETQWRGSVLLPLVAMMLAVLLYFGAVVFAIILGSFLPAFGEAAFNSIARDAIVLMLVIGTYKLQIARLGEHPRDELQLAGSLYDLGKGVGIGLAIISVIVAIASVFGIYRIVGQGDFSSIPVAFVSVAVLPAFTEEILFRGILFRWIEEFAGSWSALAATSALFGLAHIFNPGATWFSSFAIAVEAGLLLGGVYMLTRSLWMPIGLHAAWNFAEGPIFGVPVSGGPSAGLLRASVTGPAIVSGGPFGLEASVIALIVAAAVGIGIVERARRQGALIAPSWTIHR